MEKLQPLIKHKYWIIAGTALLLPFIGWWLSTGAVAETIEKRWTELSGLDVPSGSNTPNKDYIDHMDEVNKVLGDRQTKLATRLYDEQKRLHTWPGDLAAYMNDKKYREPADDQALRIYGRYHLDEIDQMLKDARQYQFHYTVDEKGKPGINETGVLAVTKESIPHVDRAVWARTPPTSSEMWDTQEDVWLTRSILEAINGVNKDATKISDAPIRVLVSLILRGGSRTDPTATSADGQSMSDVGDGGGMPGGGMPGGGMPGGAGFGETDDGGDGMSPGGFGGVQSISTNLDAVFGPDALATATDGGEGDGGPAAPPAAMPGGLAGDDGMNGTGQKKRRYVDDDPTLPYKTRGFYIEVYMLHDKLPDLQAALVSMKWPTELLIVQQVALHQDEITPVADNQTSPGLPPTTMPGGRMPGQFGGGGGGRGGGGGGGFNRAMPMPGGNTRFGGFGGGGRGGGGGGAFNRAMPMPGGGGFGGGGRGGAGGGFGRGINRFSNPMGDGGGPMGNRAFGPPMANGGEDFGGDNGRSLATSSDMAMRDPYLAQVAIAGLMTIYRSPEEMAANAENGGQATATVDETLATQPAQPETAPVENPPQGAPPETVPPGTEPAPVNPGETGTPAAPANSETKPAPAPMPENGTPGNNNNNPPPAAKTPPAEVKPAPPGAGTPAQNQNPAPPAGSNPEPAKPADE